MSKRNNFIARPYAYERVEPSRDARKIYIYCEGNVREVDYFDFFNGLSSNIDVITIKSENGRTDPVKLSEAAERDFSSARRVLDPEQNDSVWFVIDTDQWGEKIHRLRDFCHSKGDNEWHVTQSNPSLETWLYYHFFSDKPVRAEVEACKSMKEFVDKKIKGGFDCRKHPKRIETAITNSKATYLGADGAPPLYSTEVFRLGELIYPFVKDKLWP